MKLKVGFFVVLTFLFFVSVYTVKQIDGMKDSASLMFLNMESLPKFHLDKINIQRILCFSMLFFSCYYWMVSEMDENVAFKQMILYRKSKNKILSDIIVSQLKNVCFVIFMVTIAFLINYTILIQKDIKPEDISIIIYLIKFGLFMMMNGILVEFFSIMGCYTRINYTVILIYFTALLSDIFWSSTILTYSGKLNIEVTLTVLYFVCICLFYAIGFIILKRRKDIL